VSRFEVKLEGISASIVRGLAKGVILGLSLSLLAHLMLRAFGVK